MPDQLSPVLLVGTGAMAAAYAKVLVALDQPFVGAGRSAESAAAFATTWGVSAGSGPLAAQLAAMPRLPNQAIIAVSATELEAVTHQLMQAGVRRVLVEKPAALTPQGARDLAEAAAQAGVEAYVAYNRRFYAAVDAARSMIAEDGGVLSVKFDFTEARTRIEALTKDPPELAAWFYGNSTHVVDLAFFLAGYPVSLHAVSMGALAWHRAGAIFTGHGATTTGAAFSYHANWQAPGRWGVEVMTARRRLIFQPMEQLAVQTDASFSIQPVTIEDRLDIDFKPGLYQQTQAFLARLPDDRLLTIADHARHYRLYALMRDGGSLTTQPSIDP